MLREVYPERANCRPFAQGDSEGLSMTGFKFFTASRYFFPGGLGSSSCFPTRIAPPPLGQGTICENVYIWLILPHFPPLYRRAPPATF
jgi:hypothetical protein